MVYGEAGQDGSLVVEVEVGVRWQRKSRVVKVGDEMRFSRQARK